MKGYDCIDGNCPCRYCGQTKPCTDFPYSATAARKHTLRCHQCTLQRVRDLHGFKPQKYLTPKPCPWCGTSFKTDHERSKYCSRECQYASRRKPDVSHIYVARCPQCDQAFTRRAKNTFCSQKCSNRYRYIHTFVPVQPRDATCIDCGQAYTQTHGGTRRCSQCLEDRNAALKAMAKAKRRGRELATAYQPINRRRIYERDGWICYLCHQPVDRSAPNNDPRQPTLDHVWPLSLGGTHTEDNLRLACRQCNTNKRTDFLVPPPATARRRRAKHPGPGTFSGSS